MIENNINPIANLYTELMKLIDASVIKFSYLAEQYETFESRINSNQYLDAYYGKDTVFSYTDFTEEDIRAAMRMAGEDITVEAVAKYMKNLDLAPDTVKTQLLLTKRYKIIVEYEEKNNYYRMLNGYPNVEDTENLYPSDDFIEKYNLYYPGVTDLNDKRVPIPIHLIEDVLGIDYIEMLDGLGAIDEIREKASLEGKTNIEYLNYLGSNRISIQVARLSKNYEIIKLKNNNVKYSLSDEYKLDYEKCRLYAVSVLYNPALRKSMKYYDQFIGLCIMIQTIVQVITRQLPREINREFFDDRMIQMLYEMYNAPYDMNIDEITQKSICQTLNMMIRWKGSNRVLFDICSLLGFSNASIQEYFLIKDRKYDAYGVPIVLYKDQFNLDTGKVETVPDYEAMYDIYFQKINVGTLDYSTSLNSLSNRVEYREVIDKDPFWIEDDNLLKNLWETSYNYVESKYLGVSISYSLTRVMYESILLLEALMYHKDVLSDVTFTLPKISPGLTISIFDAIILLFCIISKKHNLGGEIISIPSQVLTVVDKYMSDNDDTNTINVYSFDFNWFSKYGSDSLKLNSLLTAIENILGSPRYNETELSAIVLEVVKLQNNPISSIDIYEFKSKFDMDDIDIDTIEDNINDLNAIKKYLSLPKYNYTLIASVISNIRALSNKATIKISVDENGVEHPYSEIIPNDKFVAEGIMLLKDKDVDDKSIDLIRTEMINYGRIDVIANYLGDDAEEFKSYLQVFTIDSNATPEMKIETFNKMYQNIINLGNFLDLALSKCKDIKTYRAIKEFYDTAFYSKQIKTMFTIKGNNSKERCAHDYFEFLHYYNPKLYSSLFDDKYEDSYLEFIASDNYTDWLKEHNEVDTLDNKFTLSDYVNYIENGIIPHYYGTLLDEDSEVEVMSTRLYYYAAHIISKLEDIINSSEFLYLLNDSATPLQELLIKLIKFFKSFTVDLIDLNMIFICDLKTENSLRLFDEVTGIRKTILKDDTIELAFSDVVANMHVTLPSCTDNINIHENYFYKARIYKADTNFQPNDKINCMHKTLLIHDKLNISDGISKEV